MGLNRGRETRESTQFHTTRVSAAACSAAISDLALVHVHPPRTLASRIVLVTIPMHACKGGCCGRGTFGNVARKAPGKSATGEVGQKVTRTFDPLSEADARSAAAFNRWIRDHGVTLDELAADTGLGRATLSALSRPNGGPAQTRWSKIRRSTLMAIWREAQRRDLRAATLQRFGALLEIENMHERPEVWSVEVSWIGERTTYQLISSVALKVIWDYRKFGGVQVASGPSGEIALCTLVPDGWERLGQLVGISPEG